MKIQLFVTLVTFSGTFSSPIGDGLSKLAEKASVDLMAVVNGTNEQLSDVIERKANIIKLIGSSSANAIVEAGKILSDQVSNIKVEKFLNDTEANVLETNSQIIKSAFETKRQIAKFISETKEKHQGIVIGLLNSTVTGVDAVLNSTANGIILTKEGISHVSGHINTDNAEWALSQAHNALQSAFDSTIRTLLKTGYALAKTLVDTKESLQNAALAIASITTTSQSPVNGSSPIGQTGSPSNSNPVPGTVTASPVPVSGSGPVSSSPGSGTGPTSSTPVTGTTPTVATPSTSNSGTPVASGPNSPPASLGNGVSYVNASVAIDPAINWGISQTFNGLVQSLIAIKSKTLPTETTQKPAVTSPVPTAGVASSNPLIL